MGSLSAWHWLIIAAAFLVIFGAKRLPTAARSLGQSLRIFKSEVSQLHKETAPSGAAPPTGQLPAGGTAETAATSSKEEPRKEESSQ